VDTFKEKLEIGVDIGEKLAAYYISDVLNKEVTLNSGFSREYDLLVNGKPVEVKLDVKSADTGQLILEHLSLLTHTAPTILFVLPSFYWISRKDAQFIVDTWPDKLKVGDDRRDGTPVKFTSQNFKQYFKCLKN